MRPGRFMDARRRSPTTMVGSETGGDTRSRTEWGESDGRSSPAYCVGVGGFCRRKRAGSCAGQGQGELHHRASGRRSVCAADRGKARTPRAPTRVVPAGDATCGLSDNAGLDPGHRACRRQGALHHQLRRFRTDPAHQFAQHHGCPAAERGGLNINEVSGNPFQPNVEFRGFVGIARVGHAAGIGGLSERRAHQRGLRRHHQLGSDPDRARSNRSPW